MPALDCAPQPELKVLSRDTKCRSVGVDALRGLAALAVLLFHARSQLWTGISGSWHAHGLHGGWQVWLGYSTAPIHFGWLGVPLFFVLSGYYTHLKYAEMLAKDPHGRPGVRLYYWRRFVRIYPPYAAALLFTAGLYGLSVRLWPGHPVEGDHSPESLVANLLTLQGYVAPPYGSNFALWFMSVGIHLLLVYPFLFLATRRWGAVPTVVTSSVFSVICMVLFHRVIPGGIYFGPVFLPYLLPWILGFYLAEVAAGRANLPPGWRVMGWVAGGSAPGLYFLGAREAAEVAFSLALACLVQWVVSDRNGRFSSGLLARLLATVGLFSYSLYLVHAPCLAFLRSGLFLKKSNNLGNVALASLVCIGVAWLFFQIVERWTLRRGGGKAETLKAEMLKSELQKTEVGGER